MSKYEDIANDLRVKILNQEYSSNHLLPTEHELSTMFNTSRVTVKKALDLLKKDGLIVQVKGSGTFVMQKDYTDFNALDVKKQFLGFTAKYPGQKISTIVYEFNVISATQLVASKLKLEVGHNVFQYKRLRLVNDQPICVEYSYMPVSLFPNFNKKILQESIYCYIESTTEHRLHSNHRVIRARQPNHFEKEVFSDFNKNGELAILEIEQVSFLTTGQPFEYCFIALNSLMDDIKMIIER